MTRSPAPALRWSAILLWCALALFGHAATAATYFIDSELGNDGYDGLATTPPAAPAINGPWRTLARVADAGLQPGDEVRLRCGQVWNESLRINQSGASGNPILVGAYPEPCDTAPAIDGRVAIPADNWVLDHAQVYRATVPINLVQNGALRRSVSRWTQPVAPRGTLAFKSACTKPVVGCLHFTTPKTGKGLIASPNFALRRGARYRVSYMIFVPKGVTVTARIRRSGPTDLTLLARALRIAGTGTWQQKSFDFVALASAAQARLDFEVPALRAGAANAQLRDVAVQPYIAEPLGLMMAGRMLQPAHHPNFGFDPAAPDSVYLRNDQDSDTDATPRGGSSFLTTGGDLVLPPGAAITPGLAVRIRSENWNLDQRVVTAVNGSRVDFTPGSSYAIEKGWGYFFLGAPWMVDSPDEWYYDGETHTFTVQMPDNGAPGNRVFLTNVTNGIDVAGLHDLVVENLAVRGVSTGVMLNNGQDAVLRGLTIEDVSGRGISMTQGQRITVEGSSIRRTGTDAIAACASAALGCGSDNIARNNRIEDSGVSRSAAHIVSVPASQDAAITLGLNGTVSGNKIARSGAYGIFIRGVSTVSGNAVADACLVLDDCAGIYVNHVGNGSSILGNLVNGVWGNQVGTPFPETRAAGIYLDDLVTGVTVHGNTVIGADNGIHAHNAFQNQIDGNTLYGSRRYQIWLQEQSGTLRADGDIHDNQLTSNVFVPLDAAGMVFQQTSLNTTDDFATYDGNIYSTLLNTIILDDSSPAGHESFTFEQWRASIVNGAPRNPDAHGRAIALAGFAAFRRSGSNLVPNANLGNGLSGWTRFNDVLPLGPMTLEACPGPCVKIVGAASSSLLASPNFSVVKDQWYRVSFDARTGVDGEAITVVPRRGGGGTQGFESIGAGDRTFIGTTTMKRYSFLFRASMTINANDPVTLDRGARVDFQGVQPGHELYVANLEMVAMGSQSGPTVKTAIVFNDDPSTAADVPCPDETTSPEICSSYVSLLDSAPVVWPVHLQPLESRVVNTLDPTLVDTDKDGIADVDDSCPGTPANAATNAAGCALGQ